MPNTYTQIHIQVVFAVKYRKAQIKKEWKSQLYKYITTIIQNHGHKMIQINGVEDHIHILFGMWPTEALSTLVQEIKIESSKWINKQGFCKSHFRWQSGFSAFSYSQSQLPRVLNYILNQEKHHAQKSFINEYRELLKRHGVDYDEAYIFETLK